ncbi:hypothetical protein L211DRAFT_312012 [Terfezia boudieri ATCC MYA-4762]|uniref:Uncharacterized protein n=1 Tax=Terfezia boudieri ATCC MYA-4762 TaxID=1051890 RepID=A0A3N4LY05_9PEZI|nr:hypothetical protein L211DRAFT_312012 [Terfezia boudieri ATCC MYA-4762]
MGTKKSQTSETQATSTAYTTAPQATPVTPSSNRTRGRNTVAQSTTTKSADKAAGAPKSQTENQQSQFAVPDTVRRSGRKTTLPKNLIHDSVIETPINRNRRESAASESSRRRNSSASSNKSSRKKQPAEKKPAEPPKSNIKLEGQILTSSDEEFPKTHKKGSLYGWRRLPPMTPPTPGRKTWETDSDKEERRGTRGNLGWGPVQEKQKIASEVEDSQEEGDTGSVSPPGQDEAAELGKAVAKATAPAPLVIESDDTDRDYDAELSELESSPPVSTKPRATSEIPDKQGKEDVEELQEQRPPKRRKLVLDDEAKGEEGLKSAESATSGPTTSKPKKIWVPEDDDMDFIGQVFNGNGVKQSDDPHVDEEIAQAKADLEAGEITMGDGAPGKEVDAAQKGRISEKPIVLNSPSAETSAAQEEDRMEVDAEETQETAIDTDGGSEVEQREPNAVEQSSEGQTLDENPSASQDIIMMDNKQPPEIPDVADMEYEATNETETESPLPTSHQEVVAAPDGAPETIEEDVLHTQEEVNPQIEPIWISSSESETSKNLQPIDVVTDEEDLPRPGSGMDAEPVRGDVSETEFVVEEVKGGEDGVAATPDEITTPGAAVMPHVTETVPVIVESSGVGNDEGDWMETERVKDYEVETIDGEDTNMYHEEYPNVDAEMEEEEVEASGDGEEMGIIGIVEREEAAKGDYAEGQVTMEPGEVAAAFVPVPAPLSESKAEEADEVQEKTTNDVSEIHEAAIQPPRDTTSKKSEHESTPALPLLKTSLVTVEEVGIGTSLVATEEPMASEVSPQDMDVDEDQGDQQGQGLVEQQSQDNASSSSIGDHMEDTGVEKFGELSLGVNWAEESETERRQEVVQKETPEVTSETYSKMEEVSTKDTGPIQAEVEAVVAGIEVTVSRTKAEVVEKYTVESRPEEAVKDSSYSNAESVVETKKKVDATPASAQAPSGPEEAPQPKESDDEIMEDVEKVVGDTPTIGGKDYHMQEATEEVVEKASETAQEGQVGINGESSEDKTATGSQATENKTTVTAQQEQEHKSMEQETEEREKESVAEEPDLPYRPVDDLGAEYDTIDDDDHITIYSSSSGLPSDDELGPGGLTMAITKRSLRKRRCRRSKGDKESVTGMIGDQKDQPQLDEPAFDVPSWNEEDYTVESSVPTAEPQSGTQIDEPEIEPGEPIKDLDMDDQEEPPQEFRPESPELEDEDNDDTLEPEINEDVGLPPDFDVSGSERSAEAYDGDRGSSPDAHLFSGGGLMDLLRAVEFVENTSSPPRPLQTRKEVLPSRTFKML